MNEQPRCKTCEFWYQDGPDDKAGQCRGLLWIPAEGRGLNTGPALFKGGVLPWPITARWEDRIITAADFGCVHHEPKE